MSGRSLHPIAGMAGPGRVADWRRRLLDAVLEALREDRLPALPALAPRAWARLAPRWLGAVWQTVGHAHGEGPEAQARALRLLLDWALAELRPDRGGAMPWPEAPDAPSLWLQRPAWRPLLALLAWHGLLAVPVIAGRYRPRPQEPVLETLCGLWGLSASSCYRLLARARRELLSVLARPPAGAAALRLRDHVHQRLQQSPSPQPSASQAAAVPTHTVRDAAWHRAEAAWQADHGQPLAALWHAARAADGAGFVRLLQQQADALRDEAQTDALCERLHADGAAPLRLRVELLLALARLWRLRGQPAQEQRLLEQALQLAHRQDDALLAGIGLAALARFHEAREPDRAQACLFESAEQLRRAAARAQGDATEIAHQTLQTWVQLAGVCLLRNDAGAAEVLAQAQQRLLLLDDAPTALRAALEQAWGDYWRRVGEPRRALDALQRALGLYERDGPVEGALRAALSLSALHDRLQDPVRAAEPLARGLQAVRGLRLEPDLACRLQLRLGLHAAARKDMAAAIGPLERARDIAARSGLRLHLWRAQHQLADVHYQRHRRDGDPEDERLGDAHAAAALACASVAGHAEATRRLKPARLGLGQPLPEPEPLLAADHAAHPEAHAELQRARVRLSLPLPPAEQARARLAIAAAHLAIAVAEREAAGALLERVAAQDAATAAPLQAELDALAERWPQDPGRAERLRRHWQRQAHDLLDGERRARVLAELLRYGSLSKSRYAQAAGLSPATASRHLVLLSQRGLLCQRGRGPATRYALPEDAPVTPRPSS